MESLSRGFQTWAIAAYLPMTSLKSVSSMKLHRDFIYHPKVGLVPRSPAARDMEVPGRPVPRPRRGRSDVLEQRAGGGVPKSTRSALKGRGVAGKTDHGRREGPQDQQGECGHDREHGHGDFHPFIEDRVAPDAKAYTDDHGGYHDPIHDHESVRQSVGEYRCTYPRDRKLAGHAQAGANGHIPQDQPEAHRPLFHRVRGTPQRSWAGHGRPVEGSGWWSGLKAAKVSDVSAFGTN